MPRVRPACCRRVDRSALRHEPAAPASERQLARRLASWRSVVMHGRFWSWVPVGVAALFILATAAGAHAQKVNTSSGLGVKGYDVVAYVTAGKPVEGSEQFV